MRVSDKFDQSTCGVCGDCEINQYFAINENFIEYQGTFYSLREILSSALDFQVNSDFIEKISKIFMSSTLDQPRRWSNNRNMLGLQGQTREILSFQAKSKRNPETETKQHKTENSEKRKTK